MGVVVSPYAGRPAGEWLEITKGLIERHPLKSEEIVEVVLESWSSIFNSSMGRHGFKVGVDFRPTPQIMGFFLHEFIPLDLATRYPGIWRGGKTSQEKDIVHIPDDAYSIEVKTSSHKSRIFGNRSYAQEASADKKSKSGYYLAVNFGKFSDDPTPPKIMSVRFGWLDSTDWIAQTAATGQQARIDPSVEGAKLLAMYKAG